MTNLQRRLIAMGACRHARAWVGSKSFKQAWATCKREEWMWWLWASLRNCGRLDSQYRTVRFMTMMCAATRYGKVYKRVPKRLMESPREWIHGKPCCDAIREILPYQAMIKALMTVPIPKQPT